MPSETEDFDSEDERIENLPVVGKDDDDMPKAPTDCYRCFLEQCDPNETAELLWIYEHRFVEGCRYFGYEENDPCMACTVELVENRWVTDKYHAEDCEDCMVCTDSDECMDAE